MNFSAGERTRTDRKKNIWNLRCCVLFEVSFRCQDEEGEKHFQKTERNGFQRPVHIRKMEVFAVSFMVVLSKNDLGL